MCALVCIYYYVCGMIECSPINKPVALALLLGGVAITEAHGDLVVV